VVLANPVVGPVEVPRRPGSDGSAPPETEVTPDRIDRIVVPDEVVPALRARCRPGASTAMAPSSMTVSA
jgi:hypothetical protein